jgi:La-related protein 7
MYVYVKENLPSNVYHELVKRVFSRFGNVAYVSLPKYKSTGQIKGFAFVEFDSEQGAENANKVRLPFTIPYVLLSQN